MSEVPEVLDLPVGLSATGKRQESDSMGVIEVPADRYWGAQTQRSLVHFGGIGEDRMPLAVCHALGQVKKAAALVNGRAGRLAGWQADLIARVADEVIAGRLDDHFPLRVWQTGSGTQTNMNVNEVISNRAIQLIGGEVGTRSPIHPNDHVNLAQSSNDTFPTAMHIAALRAVHEDVLPAVAALREAIAAKAAAWRDVVKIGRTHLQDAVPLTVGQEWSGYARQLELAMDNLTRSAEGLHELAAGGTAVGTGLNAPPGFAEAIAAQIAGQTGYPFLTAANKFAALGGSEAMAAASAGLRGLAVPLAKIAGDIRWLASGPRAGLGELILPANEPGSSIMPGKVNPTQNEAMLMVCAQVLGNDAVIASAGLRGLAVPLAKIAGDIRWLASGPRAGLGELILPANEPGSSIMPGKVNPTQNEAMLMVCAQVLGNDAVIASAAAQGTFELNVMRPVIIANFLHSATILAGACHAFREFCIDGTELNRSRIAEHVERSLMLVTALTPVIGYDKAAQIAHQADATGCTLREAALASGYINATDFDRVVNPAAMVGENL